MIRAKVLYDMNRGRDELSYTHIPLDVEFFNFVLIPGETFTFDIRLTPRLDENLIEPLRKAIPDMLMLKDYAETAKLGHISIDGPSGASIQVFNETMFRAPALYFWQPMTLWVERFSYSRREGFFLDLGIQWPNPGPLRLDIGKISGKIFSKEGVKPLLSFETAESVFVRNRNDNGMGPRNPNGLMVQFRGDLIGSFNPLEHFKIFFLGKDEERLSISVTQEGTGQIYWLKYALRRLPSHLTDNLFNILGAFFAHSDININGWFVGMPQFRRWFRRIFPDRRDPKLPTGYHLMLGKFPPER